MQYFIIDNGSIHLKELVQLCGREQSHVVPVDGITKLDPPADGVFVLSGSSRRGVIGHEHYYRPELALIAGATIPLVGVCLGFELIAHQAGAELIKVDPPESGLIEIFPTPEGTNWLPRHELKVSEAHRWVVADPPPGYVSLATSKDGIEAIANLSRRIVGFQFHPEWASGSHDGGRIFKTVLERITHEE